MVWKGHRTRWALLGLDSYDLVQDVAQGGSTNSSVDPATKQVRIDRNVPNAVSSRLGTNLRQLFEFLPELADKERMVESFASYLVVWNYRNAYKSLVVERL